MRYEIRLTVVVDSEHVRTEDDAMNLAHQIVYEGVGNTANGDRAKIAHQSFYIHIPPNSGRIG